MTWTVKKMFHPRKPATQTPKTWSLKEMFDMYVNRFVLRKSVAAAMDDSTRCAPPAPLSAPRRAPL